jgi:hypothetical protein
MIERIADKIATSGGMLRDTDRMRRRNRVPIAALLLLALLASGCSSGSGLGGPAATESNPPPPTTPSSAPSLTDKISNFFSNSSATSRQPVEGAQEAADCPLISIRQGASTLTIGPTGDAAAMSLKYQGTFVRAARECAVVNGQMVMKVGIEGRIIVGPAGGPGQIEVPLRIAVVYESPAGTKMILTKLIPIPVTVQSVDDNPIFTHIEEGLSFPLPSAAELENYIIYIGFDPLAAQPQEKPKAKPKSKPKAPTG